MNTRYFYKNSIADFLRQNEDEIFGLLSRNDEYDTMATQKFAWIDEIRLLKSTLKTYANEEGWVVFEYTIPRLGKRIDVVVLLRERVFVLEFKAGEVAFNRQDIDQVMDYALDLKNFHQGSASRMIVPILVATESPSYSTTVMTSHYDDGIYEPLMTNAEGLPQVFEMVLQQEVETSQNAIALAIDVRCKPNTVHWFLDDIDDMRSSLFLEDAASEFDIQGLELDWTCLIWDGDLRYVDGHWDYFEFNGGTRWNRINKEERKLYQLNAYRVLLTRARQGMVICVPKGDPSDPTRLPEIYDSTYNYLLQMGFLLI